MKTIFNVGNKEIGNGRPFFIVEEGQGNNGDLGVALQMIRSAAQVGADAIEFQLGRAEDLYTRQNPGYEIYAKREFTDSQHYQLVSLAKAEGLEFIATCLSAKLAKPLTGMGVSAFNINATDINNPDIIDAVVDSGLPFFLSLLLATEEEIDWAVNRIRSRGNLRFALLHGQHTMANNGRPVNIENTSLGYIKTLTNKYNMPVGFIDHTDAVGVPGEATKAGADLVTKHLTLDPADVKWPDRLVCLSPENMKEAIKLVRNGSLGSDIPRDKIEISINTTNRVLAPGEEKDRTIMRRSIVAARNIPQNKIIEKNDIGFKRPSGGEDPRRYVEMLGRKAKREIKADEQLKLADLREA